MEKSLAFPFLEVTAQLLQSLARLATRWEGINEHRTYDEILITNSIIASPSMAGKGLHDQRL
jgi:hypothetical protein